MAIVKKDQLLTEHLPTDTVDVEGGQVAVRALLRSEGLRVQRVKSMLDRDTLMISIGMTDPAMTPAEVEAWSDVAPAGELAAVSTRIAQLSRMMPDSGKDAIKSVPRE